MIRICPLTPSWIHRILVCTAILLFTSPQPSLAQSLETALQTATTSLSVERMMADIRTLSGPSFNGRQSGTRDDLESARWVAQEFLSAGVQLPNIRNDSPIVPSIEGKKGYFSGAMATLVPTVTISPDPVLRIGTTSSFFAKRIGVDFFPVLDSPSADLQAQIVFVGYGIVDPAHGIDDYAGIDVNNCIVLFLRGKPDHYQRGVSHADKVRFARDRGAIAYLMATGPILHPYEVRRGVTGTPSAFYGQLPLNQAIPGAWISTAMAQEILGDSKEAIPDRLRAVQEQLNHTPTSRSVQTDTFASFQWKTATTEGALINVVGMIPGTGTDVVIIGAHRDHFGLAGGTLFPGADDNASGTAVILEIARALAKAELRPSRTILFVSFSGEERDLLGSRLYTSRPIVPLTATKAMINIDHAGVGNGRLTVGVTGLEKDILLEIGKTAEVYDKLDVYGFFPGGDHVPFKEAGVPTVTVVSGGVHPHFHQSTDTADTIDPEILKTVSRYVLAVTWRLAYEP